MDILLNDAAFLYVIFTFQCLGLLIGLPLLLMQCSSAQKRMDLNKGTWFLKMMFMAFLIKWCVDTYDLVDKQMASNMTANFDPYKLLHIENDGSFDTKEIKEAYRRLALKYHPDKVDK